MIYSLFGIYKSLIFNLLRFSVLIFEKNICFKIFFDFFIFKKMPSECVLKAFLIKYRF